MVLREGVFTAKFDNKMMEKEEEMQAMKAVIMKSSLQ